MAKTKLQTFYFYNLELNTLEELKIETTLKDILKKYFEDQLNDEFLLKKDEKSVSLINVLEEGDFTFLKYEIMRYGEKKDIKSKRDHSVKGTLEKDHYVEEFQYISLKKITENSYDICFQGRQIGMDYLRFYNKIHSYYVEYKKTSGEDLSGTQLRILVYRQADFFEQIKTYNANYIKIKVSQDNEDADIKYSGKGDTVLKTKIEQVVREKKGLIKWRDENTNLESFIKKKLKEFPNAKIELRGKNPTGKKLKNIYSSDLNSKIELRVEIGIDGLIKESVVSAKMKECIENLEKGEYNRIKM